MSPEELAHSVALVARAERAEQDAASWCSKWAAMRNRAERAEDSIRAWAERARRLEGALRYVLNAGPTAVVNAINTAQAVLADLQKRQPAPVDEPIADLGKRAGAVARELRSRGVWASPRGGGVTVELPDVSHVAFCVYDMGLDHRIQRDPLAIADEIQKEEARRAQEWAGDE